MDVLDYEQELKMRSRINVIDGPEVAKVWVGDRVSLNPELALWHAKFACPSMTDKEVRADRRGVIFVRSGKKEIQLSFKPYYARDNLKGEYVEPMREEGKVGSPWFTLYFVFPEVEEELNQVFRSAMTLAAAGYRIEIIAPKLDLAFFGDFAKFAQVANAKGILSDSNSYYAKNVLSSEDEQRVEVGSQAPGAFATSAPF